MLKQIWDQWVSVVAVWGVGVFALMFNYGRLGVDPLDLPLIIFGSLGVLTEGSVAVSLARQFMSKNRAS